jgi:broad specificity phosphatase PhoE
MAALVHLVRHAEVHNPDHVVYASLPGFGLSPRGRRQAWETARHLASRPVVAVWSSPLQRAVDTAAEIAARFALPVAVEPGLVEWRLSETWAGICWEDLPTRRPGELEAYLRHPLDLAFSPESLADLAGRMASTVERLHHRHPEGEVVVVSHQDPVQAARLHLTGASLADLHRDKPGHGTVLGLRPGSPWTETGAWSPPEQEAFPPA